VAYSKNQDQSITGEVSWFADDRGYGFAKTPDGQQIFIHHQHIMMSGYRLLFSGDQIRFLIKQDEQGRAYAADIQKIS
jgi:CspA family cold shock protein